MTISLIDFSSQFHKRKMIIIKIFKAYKSKAIKIFKRSSVLTYSYPESFRLSKDEIASVRFHKRKVITTKIFKVYKLKAIKFLKDFPSLPIPTLNLLDCRKIN